MRVLCKSITNQSVKFSPFFPVNSRSRIFGTSTCNIDIYGVESCKRKKNSRGKSVLGVRYTKRGQPDKGTGVCQINYMEPTMPKNGQQMLSHLLAIAYHVLEEIRHMNLKPPLRPISKLYAADLGAPGSPSSEAETPHEESPGDINGLTAGFTGGHAQAASQGYPIVVPFSPEEIQDTYTKIAALKTQYIKLSGELLEAVREVEKKNKSSEPLQEEEGATVASLAEKRNRLRKEVYERNVVMKGLIDRLRNLQHSIRLMKGCSAYPPIIVMESV